MESCIIFIAASFAVWNPLLALGAEFGGDEFSNDTLAYKLELLNHTFWRTEQELSSRGVVGLRLDQMRYPWIEKNHLGAQFLCGNFYPDLLNERISLLREKLREDRSQRRPPENPIYRRTQLRRLRLVDSRDRRTA
jgi:hypothetical protein